MKTVSELKKKWQKNPEFKKEYEAQAEEFAVAHALIEARVKANLTQSEVAKRMDTSQSAIARLESGNSNPSVEFLKRYAHATGTHLKIELEPSRH